MSVTVSTPAAGTWRIPMALLLVVCVMLVGVYWDTYAGMVGIWMRSETFAHGFLIVPISAYLIWCRRHMLAQLTPRPARGGLVFLAGAGVVWLLARIAGVQVFEQLGAVALIPAAVWAVLGWEVVWAIAFPLAFLIFAVPMGEDLIPPMVDFTASFTVGALQFTGIPVFREGSFFSIPSGDWSVVEGCSGVRYLIASVTLGCLYAYMTYRSLRRRLIFIVISFIVPVIANGLRAYMIVMIAHLSDMRLAMGVDHFIYGWVFFGVVMMLLFGIGAKWREDEAEPTFIPLEQPRAAAPGTASMLAMTLGAIVVAGAWPVVARVGLHTGGAVAAVVVPAPAVADPWHMSDTPATTWHPLYGGTDGSVAQTYTDGQHRVVVHLMYYHTQRQDAELVNSRNLLVKEKDPHWRRIGKNRVKISLRGVPLDADQAQLDSGAQHLLVWQWYWLDGRVTTNPYFAKLWLARARLFGGRTNAAAVIIATEYDEETAPAAHTLQEFVTAMGPAIDASLRAAGHEK